MGTSLTASQRHWVELSLQTCKTVPEGEGASWQVHPGTGPESPPERSVLVSQPCPHYDQPELSLLRLVFIGEILLADETWLLRLVDVLQQSGLWRLAEQPTAPHHPHHLEALKRHGVLSRQSND